MQYSYNRVRMQGMNCERLPSLCKKSNKKIPEGQNFSLQKYGEDVVRNIARSRRSNCFEWPRSAMAFTWSLNLIASYVPLPDQGIEAEWFKGPPGR